MNILNNRSRYLFPAPIEITSPEQFVPIYLAYLTDTQLARVSTPAGEVVEMGPMNAMEDRSMIDSQGRLKPRDNRGLIKDNLMRTYDKPYPKRYALPIPMPSYTINPDLNQDSNIIIKTFLLHAQSSYAGYTMSSHIFLEGFVASYRSPVLNNITTRPYSFHTSILRRSDILDLDPVGVILVRAKWIPIIKVGVALRMEYAIGYGDLRVLTLDSKSEYDRSLWGRIVDGMNSYLTSNDIRIETLPREEILSYIIGPYTVPTPEEILKKAVALVKRELTYAPVNV